MVRAALDGRPDALDDLEQALRLVPGIVAANNRRLATPLAAQELEEVVQDVLMTVWRKLPGYEGRAALRTWIYRVSTLELLSAGRRLQRQRRIASTESAPEPVDLASEPSQQAAERELLEVLGTLSHDESAVLDLKHDGGLTFDQIGARLGVTANVAKGLYYRTLRRVRGELKGKLGGEGP